MLMSHGKMFMTALTLLGMITSLHWPAVVQAGGGGERCVELPPPSDICRIISVEVEIDIKPGANLPSINPRSHGKLHVIVLTTETFAATTVDPDRVFFGPFLAAPVHWDLQDVNGDGYLDLQLQFHTEETGIQCGDTFADLTGRTFPVFLLEENRIVMLIQEIIGTDTFRTVGCHTK